MEKICKHQWIPTQVLELNDEGELSGCYDNIYDKKYLADKRYQRKVILVCKKCFCHKIINSEEEQ